MNKAGGQSLYDVMNEAGTEESAAQAAPSSSQNEQSPRAKGRRKKRPEEKKHTCRFQFIGSLNDFEIIEIFFVRSTKEATSQTTLPETK